MSGAYLTAGLMRRLGWLQGNPHLVDIIARAGLVMTMAEVARIERYAETLPPLSEEDYREIAELRRLIGNQRTCCRWTESRAPVAGELLITWRPECQPTAKISRAGTLAGCPFCGLPIFDVEDGI